MQHYERRIMEYIYIFNIIFRKILKTKKKVKA